MINYFIKKYAMSEIGAHNLRKSIISNTVLNFAKLFPPITAFIFLFQYLGSEEGISSLALEPMNYIVMIVAMLVIMFMIARWNYVRLYTNVYEESANSRIELANRLKQLPLSYFGKRDIADIGATMMADMTLYEEIFSHAVPNIYSTAFTTAIISLMILLYNWKLGVAALWVIPVALLIYKGSRHLRNKTNREWLQANREVFDDLQEKIDQIQEIRAYNLEEKAQAEFNQKLSSTIKKKTMIEIVSGVSLAFAALLLRLGIVSVAILGASMVLSGEIHVLTYIVFLILTSSLYLPIESILAFMGMIDMLDSVVSRIKEIKTMPIQEGRSDVCLKNYDIEFDDVIFGYEDYSVINGASFVAKQGEVTALIGPSGCGKTTLTKLAARFWDIQKGKILLGGEDISKIDPEALLKNFSIVFQDVVLFNASIKDNIRIGKKGASDEEIMQAAKIARCDEFVKHMPQGMDTIVGENGQRLSGGERQRISIARAILKDAEIILLDEATASLDVENESLIQEALSELIKDKTVIVIAHRMRTIRSADKIVLLNNGKVEAMGTDEELRKQSKMYQSMIEKSLS